MQLAVIKTGGKQYLVTEGMTLDIEKLVGEPASEVKFTEVLLVVNDDQLKLGTPLVDGAMVIGQIVKQGRDPKVTVAKMKRRKRYRRVAGHKQFITRVEIMKI
ncbi:TPA: 50S ribosomal protein L21 [Patescibacteria group bacterium]|uniref:Large ribosomal subunit protein bL21 n=2 Tax=Bacteria division Kazan-3B-28 TaxID=1798534 RepID=A0A0G1ZG80_UNCK3|nr:MAG: 50S ribosomal protein L21, large subunit ribosomal protein L21 [candidate division Kazan bacterium GW2011_GWA1_50_15]KKW25602.1 MAG: 50S ribosomal protein L21 [candidate division Kazan bacterium GW2011_GWC1_52_13]KKW26907.1 MAG: 50S ribosomal protein L21 [candidate division Kazan bacterium GW2011_GWB1_52_7]HAV66101.1 50S ribosomal protein L21 [Patescibacteria group bacterium]HCL47656.1 50S ribosomal protein L21 [Patescibacteria group bacterium]